MAERKIAPLVPPTLARGSGRRLLAARSAQLQVGELLEGPRARTLVYGMGRLDSDGRVSNQDLDEEQCLVYLREQDGTARRQPVSWSLMVALLDHAEARGAAGDPGAQLLRYRITHDNALTTSSPA